MSTTAGPATSPPSAAHAASGKAVREGSASKRQAILLAARELFVRDGVDRVSMDAVAAAAGVSKRTVYDYYGDKRGLLLGVVEEAAASLIASLRSGLDEHLSDDAGIEDAAALERAFTAFAVQLATSTLTSADYATLHRLVLTERGLIPEFVDHPMADAPEEAIAERIAHYDAAGILEAPDARLAADHFNALTTMLAYNAGPEPAKADPARVERSVVNGVHAFMRAYRRG